MNNSWLPEETLNGVSDDFFDDVMKYLDFPLEEVDGKNIEEWDANFQALEPPPANVLAGWTSDLYDEFSCDGSGKNFSVSSNRSSELIQPSTREASSGRIVLLKSNSADVKDSSLFQTSSPVSVLENSSSCSAKNITTFDFTLKFPVKRTRSQRRRASTFNQLPTFDSAPSLSASSASFVASESESDSYFNQKPAKRQKKKKNLTVLSGSSETKKSSSQQAGPVRKCTHCEVTKTPQWREGPNGPKTLCNACGVRYRSGRLLPEYRPAASPTFIPSVHSNSHKKVIEMRKKTARLQAVTAATNSVSSPLPETPCG